jgi:predicted amidohydrolase
VLLNIGIVEFKPETGEKEKNVSKGLEIIEQAADRDVDILCFPELWTTGYLAGTRFTALAEKIPGPTTKALASASAKHKIFLIGGAIAEVAGRNLYDTVFAMDRNGKIVGKHRKAHLWEDYENEYFTPGRKCTVTATEFGEVGLGVCFDGDFQEYSRVLAVKGAKIFFNPSGYPSSGRKDWRIYSSFARQNGFYVVSVNLVGHEAGTLASSFYPNGVDFLGESRIIDPYGKTVVQSDPERRDTALYVAQIDLALVEKARNQPYFNLRYRRPELYAGLTAKK